MFIAKTATRVAANTPAEVNERIRLETEREIRLYEKADPAMIRRRLAELDAEWDIERTLETNAAAFALAGMLLGKAVHRSFYLLPAAVMGFLLQHALQGWCPPVGFFRRRGVRTPREIEEERAALLAALGESRED